MIDFIKIFIVVSFTAVCFATQAFAASLNSIELKPADKNFDVVLNSGEKIDVKKTFSNDSMILTLKNTKPADGFSLKYNVSDLDNVLVKTDKNNTKIIIKSKRIVPPTNSNNYAGGIIFLTLAAAALTLKKKEKKEQVTFMPKPHYGANLDYIIQHKLKQQKEKIEIAA